MRKSLYLCHPRHELAPNSPFLQLSYASFLVDQQRYDEALAHARACLRIKSVDYRVHNIIGSIMLATGDLGPARQHITEALRLQPDYQ